MAFWPAWLHVWSQFHNVQRVLRCSASDCGFITYFTECGADVTSSLYINPWTALNFRGVSLLTLNQDGLLSLSFAVFLPGFQWTTGGVWSRVWSVYEQQQQKKKKKPRQSLRRVQFPEQKHRESPAVVSPAAAKSLSLLLRCLHAGTSRQLSRVKLSRVTQPDPSSGPRWKPRLIHLLTHDVTVLTCSVMYV